MVNCGSTRTEALGRFLRLHLEHHIARVDGVGLELGGPSMTSGTPTTANSGSMATPEDGSSEIFRFVIGVSGLPDLLVIET